jgi:hypothetical protein
MRRYEDPNVRVPATLNAAYIADWRDHTRALGNKPDWKAWLRSTYEVYRQTASHFDVRSSRWWQDVLVAASENSAPEDVADAIELLDAMAAKDGERLWAVANKTLPKEEFPLPLALRSIAGMLALEMRGASAQERHAYVDRWMKDIGHGDDSEDYAYRVLRAYASRE